MTARVPLCCLGGSAGSLTTVRELLAALPPVGEQAFVLALHRSHSSDDGLVALLQESTSRPVQEIDDQEEIRAGRVYVCPPDYSVLISGCHLVLTQVITDFHSYPSIDALFETYADEYGSQSLVVALSCANTDGAAGAARVHIAGGTVITQRRDSVEYPNLVDAIRASGYSSIDLDRTEIIAHLTALARGASTA